MLNFFKENYILIIILVVGTIISYIWVYFFNKEKLQLTWWGALLACLFATIMGALALRLFALIEAGFNKEKDGNLSFFGGVFILPLFALIYSKIKKLPYGLILDVFTVVLVILTFGRVNCIISGCCYGKLIPNTSIRYPTREIELIFDALFLPLIIFFNIKGKCKGKIYFLYLMSYGLVRFITEFMRYSSSGSTFHIGHLWAGLSIVIGATTFIVLTYLEKQKQSA